MKREVTRTHDISVRVTEKEYNQLMINLEKSNSPNVSDCLRKCAFKNVKCTIKKNIISDDALELMREYRSELGHLGNSLIQIAKAKKNYRMVNNLNTFNEGDIVYINNDFTIAYKIIYKNNSAIQYQKIDSSYLEIPILKSSLNASNILAAPVDDYKIHKCCKLIFELKNIIRKECE